MIQIGLQSLLADLSHLSYDTVPTGFSGHDNVRSKGVGSCVCLGNIPGI